MRRTAKAGAEHISPPPRTPKSVVRPSAKATSSLTRRSRNSSACLPAMCRSPIG